MTSSTAIALDTAFTSFGETARVTPRAVRRPRAVAHAWSGERADSVVGDVAGALVLASTALVSLAAFAHVFLG